MNNKAILKTIGLLVILFALYVLASAAKNYVIKPVPEPEQVFCTQDAKLCPDGSYVGRIGPHCEFALCPSEALMDQ
jgi:hypothetical protein